MPIRALQMVERFITDPVIRFGYLTKLGIYDGWKDEEFIKKKYRLVTGEKLNINNPKLYNEKIQWLKLYDRREIYTTMVDKFAVKQWVADCVGEKYIIPTLGVWNCFDDIDLDCLPDQFVLKCTHDSGGVIICKDKSRMNLLEAKKILTRSLKRNYFYEDREWPYKNVAPRIMAEKYMVDESGFELKDYKIFCFDGEPKLIQVDFDRFGFHRRNIYTTKWDYVNASIKYPKDPQNQITRPKKLEEMLNVASCLSRGIPHVRVDLYYVGDRIYFGEMTFHHGGGMEKFTPRELEVQMGNWIKLPVE